MKRLTLVRLLFVVIPLFYLLYIAFIAGVSPFTLLFESLRDLAACLFVIFLLEDILRALRKKG